MMTILLILKSTSGATMTPLRDDYWEGILRTALANGWQPRGCAQALDVRRYNDALRDGGYIGYDPIVVTDADARALGEAIREATLPDGEWLGPMADFFQRGGFTVTNKQ